MRYRSHRCNRLAHRDRNHFGIEDEDIKEVLLAGAFGNYIRRVQAKRIGLLPDIPKERIRFIGNAEGEY